jgi:hypothetical protein
MRIVLAVSIEYDQLLREFDVGNRRFDVEEHSERAWVPSLHHVHANMSKLCSSIWPSFRYVLWLSDICYLLPRRNLRFS